MRPSPARIGGAILVAGLVAAAAGCGGGGKSSPSTTGDSVSLPVSNGAPTTLGSSTPSFASAKNCQDLAGLAAKVASTVEASSGNGSQSVQSEEAELQALANAAPSDIKGDFQTFATAFSGFLHVLQRSGYKLGSTTTPTPAQALALTKAAKLFDTAKLKHAEQHLSAWARQNCQGVHVGG